MWQKSLWVAAGLLYSACALAFDWHQPAMNSRLWKISKAGEPESYLLGTYHLGRPDSTLPEPIERIVQNSEVVLTEVRLADGSSPEAAEDLRAAQERMLDKESGQTLSDKIGSGRVQALAERLQERSATRVTVRRLNQMEPWAAVMVSLAVRPAELSSEQGVDRQLSRAAAKYHIANEGLEQYRDLPERFIPLPKNQIIELLDFKQYHRDQGEALTRRMFALYEAHDYPQLMALSADSSAYSQGMSQQGIDFWQHWLEQDLLVQRNQRWLPKLLAVLPKKRALVAVGMAHLVDDSGLIMQLRQHGYRVEAVSE